MNDRILINKDLIPYSFDILLGESFYTILVNYNDLIDLFTLTLLKEGELICTEPILYGQVLFTDIYKQGLYPAVTIVPMDESGKESGVTWDNFNNTVFLCIDDGSDAEDET